MKFTPFQLAAIAVGMFGSIILLNVLAQYRSNENFKEYLHGIEPTDILRIRTRRIAEENMEEAIPANLISEEDNADGE